MSFNRQKLDGHPGPFNIARKVVNTSADYVMQPEDDNVIVNAAGHTVHLPLGGGGLVALEHVVYAQGVATTVDGNGSLINGAASLSMSANEATQITWDPVSQSWVAGFMSGSPSGGGSGLFNTNLVNGQNNNVNTNGFSVVRSGGNTAAAQISGWHAPSLPGAGQTSRFVYVNTTAFPITIQNENTGSLAAQRIQTLRGVDVVLPSAGSSAAFVYDSTVSRWVQEHIGMTMPMFANVRDFGATGNGTTDDTTAIQNAVNYLISGGNGGSLFFPAGIYNVSSTILVEPGASASVRLHGAIGYGISATSIIRWAPTVNSTGPVMWWRETTACTMSHLTIQASSDFSHGKQFCFQIDEGPLNSAEDQMIENCIFSVPIGTDNACIAIGTGPTNGDLGFTRFRHCEFVGSVVAGTKLSNSGVRILGSGNIKDFEIDSCIWRQFARSAIRFDVSLSGTMVVKQPFTADCGVCIFEVPGVGDGSLICIGGADEGTDRILYSSSISPGGSIILEGMQWAGQAIDDSALFAGAFVNATADVAIWTDCSLSLRGCFFLNGRTSTSQPKIFNSITTTSHSSSIDSWGCYFSECSEAPFYDLAGNYWLDAFARTVPTKVTSRFNCGNLGPNNTGAFSMFQSVEGSNLQVGQQTFATQQPVFQSAGVGTDTAGVLAMSIAKFHVDFTTVNALGAVTQVDLAIAWMPPKTRIMSVVADTTIAWVGPAGPVTLSVGDASGAPNTQYLLAHTVSAGTVRKGEHTADLGMDLAPTANNAFGFIQSWTTNEQIIAEWITAAGTLNQLTAGHTDFYVVLQRLP